MCFSISHLHIYTALYTHQIYQPISTMLFHRDKSCTFINLAHTCHAHTHTHHRHIAMHPTKINTQFLSQQWQYELCKKKKKKYTYKYDLKKWRENGNLAEKRRQSRMFISITLYYGPEMMSFYKLMRKTQISNKQREASSPSHLHWSIITTLSQHYSFQLFNFTYILNLVYIKDSKTLKF